MNLLERLRRYHRSISPHYASKEGGKLIAAAAEEIERLRTIIEDIRDSTTSDEQLDILELGLRDESESDSISSP